MKTLVSILTLVMSFTISSTFASSSYPYGKEPVVIEVMTDYTNPKDALLAAKNALLQEKFIASEGLQETSFTAKRTTASTADYYIADVMAVDQDGKVQLTITFVKVGTGMLKLSKVSEKVKESLVK